jgi:hypothetical protein
LGEAWKKVDLGGGGLQSANITLARLLKRRRTAYALLALFPLGLHRDYLEDSSMGWVYRGLSGAALAALLLGAPWATLGIAAASAVLALRDLRWIDDRVATLNKALRVKVYLAQGSGAPRGFKGRYPKNIARSGRRGSDPEAAERNAPPEKDSGDHRGGDPSFAEQEALLRELARRKQERGS